MSSLYVARRIGDTPPHFLAGFDTSERLNGAQGTTLWNLGYRWGSRYVPLFGQSPAVGIQKDELLALCQAGHAINFVQFARGSGWSASTGLDDGKTAGEYVLGLNVPNTVCVWCDLAPPPNASAAIAYVNAWFEGTIQAGMDASAAGIYCEPGVPLTSQQRYANLNLHRYWATAANDPQRFVAQRGCQIIQLWPGDRIVAPGLIIDSDAAQSDYFGQYAVGAALAGAAAAPAA